VAAEVLLEVENRERVTLVEREELAERGVRLDRLLVHKALAARIRHHALRDRRAADLRVLGLAQERAELGRDLHRLREDARLGLRTLNRLRLALAAAIRLLREARRLLLNDLERGRRRAEGRLEARELLVEVSDRLLERGTDVLLNRLSGGGGHDSGGRSRDRRRRRSLSLGLVRLRLRDLRSGGRRRGRRSDLSLGGSHSLRRRLRLGGTHFEVVGGINGRHGTRMPALSLLRRAVKFGAKKGKVADPGATWASLSY